MSIAALLGVIWHFSKEKLVPFLKENWKQTSWAAFLLWVIMCLLTHCTGIIDPWGRHGNGGSDTVSVRVDTAWVYPDTAAIFALYGFDTVPIHIEHLHDSIRQLLRWHGPQAPVFHPDSDCSDSLAALWHHSEVLAEILDECDSAYYDAVAVRHYGDTLRNDSIEVTLGFRVEGRLRGEPDIRYSYLAPYPVITNTITLKDPPRRQVYVGGGIGPRFLLNGNQIDAVMVNAELGYTTRKSLSIGLAGDFTHKDYEVRAVIRKGFNIGK